MYRPILSIIPVIAVAACTAQPAFIFEGSEQEVVSRSASSLANTFVDLENPVTGMQYDLELRADGTGTAKQGMDLAQAQVTPIVWEERNGQLCVRAIGAAGADFECSPFDLNGPFITLRSPNGASEMTGGLFSLSGAL